MYLSTSGIVAPYYNSTSGFDFDLRIVISMSFRMCLPNFVMIGGGVMASYRFLQRVGIAESYSSAVYAMIVSVRPSVCLSVCPSSVTFRCFVETNEATIMRFSPTGRAIILVSEEVKIIWKFARDHP